MTISSVAEYTRQKPAGRTAYALMIATDARI